MTEQEKAKRIDELFETEDLREAAAQYIKFDVDQLLAILTAIVISGRCFSDMDGALVHRSARVAYDIYDRIVRHQEYTEYEVPE